MGFFTKYGWSQPWLGTIIYRVLIIPKKKKIYICSLHKSHAFSKQHCTDSKGYLVDEDGFDYMKISFLREIKSQQRSLRLVFPVSCNFYLIFLLAVIPHMI